jgi:NAD(P)-dependent dehydrogenase (short-subunit alcohol dehydrogenase family)
MYLEKYDLRGRVAVVTGGGQGIGLACAQALGEAGAVVVVADLVEGRAQGAAAELAGLGIEASGLALDVTRSQEVDAAAAAIAAAHGPVAILVNNAGVAKSNVRAEDTSDAHWRFHMDVNLDGVFWCCRAFGRQMLAQGKGSIVNIGSMSGVIANKPQPQAFYNASKAAVHHLTRSLAAEWAARGVRAHPVRHGGPGALSDLARDDPHGPGRPARGDRVCRPVPRLGRRLPPHRQHRPRRWRLYLLVSEGRRP